MWRVYVSRWLNYHLLGGRQGQMISTRAYVEHWQFTEIFIDFLFDLIRGEKYHCRNSFYLEVAMMRDEDDKSCPVCKKPIGDSASFYAMGWHVTVCSRECQIKAHERLMHQNQLMAQEFFTSEYAGPDT